MKVIFLDIDGVLNCNSSNSRCGPFIGIDDKKVKLLARIVQTTKAEIVLVSSWKSSWNPDYEECKSSGQYLVRKLKRQGLHILDKTSCNNSDRGQGIYNWIGANKFVTNYCVLDDEVFKDYAKYGIMSHLVKTSFYEDGLTDKHVEEAIKLLE